MILKKELIKKFIYCEKLIKLLGPKCYFKKIYFFKNFCMVKISLQNFLFLIKFLKFHENFQYTNLIDISGIDYPEKLDRFLVFYHLLSVNFGHRITILLEINEMGSIPSISFLFKSANWMEREMWDMFGIFFLNHPDLRRILTDYGFEGFPLRKDFPLTGYEEVRYDDEKKRVIYEPLEISQEFRSFNFLSPWEQLKNLKIK